MIKFVLFTIITVTSGEHVGTNSFFNTYKECKQALIVKDNRNPKIGDMIIYQKDKKYIKDRISDVDSFCLKQEGEEPE